MDNQELLQKQIQMLKETIEIQDKLIASLRAQPVQYIQYYPGNWVPYYSIQGGSTLTVTGASGTTTGEMGYGSNQGIIPNAVHTSGYAQPMQTGQNLTNEELSKLVQQYARN